LCAVGLTEGRCDISWACPSVSTGADDAPVLRLHLRVRVSRGPRLPIASLADTRCAREIGVHLWATTTTTRRPLRRWRRAASSRRQGYSIFGDYDQPNPPARLIEAVASGEVDVAIVWGPLAGYFAQRQSVPLSVVPVPAAGDVSGQQWTFPIAMGVRHRDIGLAQALDRVLAIEQPAVQKLLTDYGVPLVDAPTPAAGAAARAP
jgi:hypothetical protein